MRPTGYYSIMLWGRRLFTAAPLTTTRDEHIFSYRYTLNWVLIEMQIHVWVEKSSVGFSILPKDTSARSQRRGSNHPPAKPLEQQGDKSERSGKDPYFERLSQRFL